MKRTGIVRLMALLLAVLTLCGGLGISLSASTSSDNMIGGTSSEELKAILNAASYLEYSSKFYTTDASGNKVTVYEKGAEEIVLKATDLYSYSDGKYTYRYDKEKSSFYYVDENGKSVYVTENEVAVRLGDYADRNGVVLSPTNGTLTWQVTIPATGRYAMEIVYYPLGENSTSIERTLHINGKVPFDQARYLTLSKIWKYDYPLDADGNPTFKKDKNGNEIKPSAVTAPEWTTVSFTDPNGFYQGAFEFVFDNEGKSDVTHTIALASSREAMYIESIRLYPYEEVKSYADVLAMYQQEGWQAASSDAQIRFEAEKPYRVSDTSVFAANDRSSAVNSPISSGSQLLNVLGNTSYDTIGQWVSYKFTVPEDGLYTISIRCKQDKLAGMYTSRTIRLAGGIYGDTLAVPFAEAYNSRFNYDKSWQIATLGDGTNVFQFYFQKGTEYTMSLDVSLGTLAETIETVEDSLNVINNCYLEILKLTGATPDEYRDYKFNRVMPETVRNLLRQYRVLDGVSKGLVELSGSKGSHVATLDKVAFLLYTMGYHQDKIAANLSDLKSYIGTLGTWLNDSKQQSLMMDYIVISGVGETSYEASVDVKLDKKKYPENASFFQFIGFEISSFIMSFVVDYDQMGVTDENDNATKSIEVWLASGRDQANIWRGIFNSEFTADTGIAINLKLVTAGTLLPSVLAKQGPDVYMGLGSGDVINYAIRSAVVPVTQYIEQDPEILNDFNDACMGPLIMLNEYYGVPETASFSMMFYRKDALANLGIGIPQTWDDLLTAVPVLQSSNMLIGLSRNYNMFLYQAGGDRWEKGGQIYGTAEAEGTRYEGTKYTELMQDEKFASYFDYMTIGYGTNVALDTFKYMCRFYTDYGFPVTFEAANRFRTGEMPLVISDAVGMYNQLTVFATEIRGLWMFTKVPGTVRSDGKNYQTSIAGVTAVVMMNGVEDTDSSWNFIRWQVSPDVQAYYGNNMVSLIGPSAKYATANMNALLKMSWTTEEYNALYDQFQDLALIPNYPGSYIIDRYLDFAFLNTYNDGLDPIEQLENYIKTINKEITRKREEFDLPVLEDDRDKTIDDSIDAYLDYLKTQSKKDPSILDGYSDLVKEYVKNYED